MVLVCKIALRAGLFVSCDEQKEMHCPNHLLAWLLPRQWSCFITYIYILDVNKMQFDRNA